MWLYLKCPLNKIQNISRQKMYPFQCKTAVRKRSMSEGDIEPQDSNTDTRDMVSKVKYGKYRTTKSLDERKMNG